MFETGWWLHAGLDLAAIILAGSLVIALWASYVYRPGRISREVARTAYWFSLFSSIILLPIALYLDPSALSGHSVASVLWPVAVAPLIGLFTLMQDFRRRYFVASLVVTLGAATALYMLG